MKCTITVLPVNEVRRRLGNISRTTLWRAVQLGHFPAPARISARRIGWAEHQVTEWLEKKFGGSA